MKRHFRFYQSMLENETNGDCVQLVVTDSVIYSSFLEPEETQLVTEDWYLNGNKVDSHLLKATLTKEEIQELFLCLRECPSATPNPIKRSVQ